MTKEQIMQYPSIESVYKKLISILGKYCNKYDKQDKFFFAGYNTYFDFHMLRQFFDDNGDKYFGSWFWSNPIDIMSLATTMLIGKRQSLVNFKLVTVASSLGFIVDENKAHDALYDIYMTKWIYDEYAKKHHPELVRNGPSVDTSSIDDLIQQTSK